MRTESASGVEEGQARAPSLPSSTPMRVSLLRGLLRLLPILNGAVLGKISDGSGRIYEYQLHLWSP